MAAAQTASGQSVATLNVVRVVTINSLTGSQAAKGQAQADALQLAVREYQPQFARLGLDLQVAVQDDSGKAPVAGALMAKALNDPSVFGVLGSVTTTTTLPLLETLKGDKLPVVTASPASDELLDRGYGNVFRLIARSDDQVATMSRYAAGTLRVRSVYLVSDATTYGDGLAAHFEREAAGQNMMVVGRIGTVKRDDFSELVGLIKSKNPDLIYFGGQYDVLLPLLKALRTAGVTARVAGANALDTPDFLQAGDVTKGVLYTTPYGAINRFSASTFNQQFQQAYERLPLPRSLYAYDASRALLQGILNATTANGGQLPTRAQVAAAMHKLRFTGATGQVAFNTAGERIRTPLFIMRIDENSLAPTEVRIRMVGSR